MINLTGSVDCGAFVSEKFWHHFWQKTFSTESIYGECPFRGIAAATREAKHGRHSSDRRQTRIPQLVIPIAFESGNAV